MSDLLQAASADAVHTFLVFLDLLKGQAETACKIGLAKFEQEPSHPHAAADLLVDQDGRLLPPRLHRMVVSPDDLDSYVNVEVKLKGFVSSPLSRLSATYPI